MNNSYNFDNEINRCKTIVENRLQQLFEQKEEKLQKPVIDAMRYSVLNGGKRIRAFLLMETAQAFGCDFYDSADIACCVEMVHAYSLIHDDLPCMDDDDFRRGIPSCHKKFGEAVAVLAGDGLQTMAFEVLSNIKTIEKFGSDAVLKMIDILSNSIGENGMLGGQTIDVCCEGIKLDNESHLRMVKMKTAALISCSISLGCICAKRIDVLPTLNQFGEYLGIAFQIKDDILDIIGSSQVMGKSVGSDKLNDKNTFVSLYGMEKSKELCDYYHKNAISLLKNVEFSSKVLIDTANFLAERNY